MIQIRVVFPQKHFSLVVCLREDFFKAQYFTKVIATNHSSTDTLFLRRALATINCTYKKNLTDLFKADFYLKGVLAAIRFSCTIIFSGGHLQWSIIFNGAVFLLSKHLQSSLFYRYWFNSQVQLQPFIRWITLFLL